MCVSVKLKMYIYIYYSNIHNIVYIVHCTSYIVHCIMYRPAELLTIVIIIR